ncbi:LysR substrate-binding domain-containing protein, partial [Sphingomonas bacterium]|uniref:LysR substrate-binding domain-containing protein n=1 Tax=Sphingomonas bacterium TaxID=1895847 RepID=UPI0020C63A68
GRPAHPRDLLGHACLRGRFSSGAMPPWEYERAGEVVRVDPAGPLIVGPGGAIDLMVAAAVAGAGVVHLFEDWLRPDLDAGRLEPVLADWQQPFGGPFLYYPGRRHLPAPLRAFVDFVKGGGE